MKKNLLLLMSVCFIILLTACNQKQEEEAVPQFLDVKLSVTPEKGEPKDEIQFDAKVTYGEEEVNDADEVEFEIWRSKDENHEKVEVKESNKGVYTLRKSFSKEGTYYVISHVTAKDMHAMPKKEFVVGKASEPEEE